MNVASQSDITVTVNGIPTTNFSYNITTKELLLNTNLVIGANIIETKAVNNVGMDVEATTIIYAVPNAPKPPIVTFLDPAADPTVVYVSNYNVIAKWNMLPDLPISHLLSMVFLQQVLHTAHLPN